MKNTNINTNFENVKDKLYIRPLYVGAELERNIIPLDLIEGIKCELRILVEKNNDNGFALICPVNI